MPAGGAREALVDGRPGALQALLIDAVVVPSNSAASRPVKPRASLRISAARCFGVRCWSAATKASSSSSRRS